MKLNALLYSIVLLSPLKVSADSITIHENKDTKITGIEQNGEIYVPFSYLKEKYNLYGKKVGNEFELSHSGRSLIKFEPYQAQGEYLNFQYHNIQSRSTIVMDARGVPRVKYNWGIEYNPTTVAQYALQLYSQTIHRKGDELIPNDSTWDLYTGYSAGTEVNNRYNSELRKIVKRFIGDDLSHGYELVNPQLLSSLNDSSIISWKVNPVKNFRFYFQVKTNLGYKYITYYDGNDGKELPSVQGDYIYIPIKTEPGKWSTIVRNLQRDLTIQNEALQLQSVKSLLLRGSLELSDIKVYSNDDFSDFFTQNDWLVENQDLSGGWPYDFDFLFFVNRVETLKSGWYSAIAQGTGISALTRAYQISNNEKYIQAAKYAADIYTTPVEEGGVLRYWQGNEEFPFYEEYPTTPASHVLNGYQFSLLGAYDLWQATGDIDYKSIYKKGIGTLKEIVPLYDTGHRTNYDLTYYTAKAYPNHANWHYHTVHIDMMMALNHIEKDDPFVDLIERWKGYMKGNHVSRD